MEKSLYHHGIKGQKWGVRRFQNEDGTLTTAGEKRYSRSERKTIKEARRDAKRFADAKMYYGDGAGTRRKLLKAELSGKMKDPLYKEYFDKGINDNDWNKSSVKARRDRRAADTKARIGKTKRHILRTLAGTSSIATLAATAYFANPKVRSYVNSSVQKMYSSTMSNLKTRDLRRWASKIRVYTD